MTVPTCSIHDIHRIITYTSSFAKLNANHIMVALTTNNDQFTERHITLCTCSIVPVYIKMPGTFQTHIICFARWIVTKAHLPVICVWHL